MSKKRVTNPTGKGGFRDNPQNRASGRWKPENSQAYCLNYFLSLTEDEFALWAEQYPPNVRTMAQTLAFNRVAEARGDLPNYKEVVDRTEGKPMQYSEVNANVETKSITPELLSELDAMYEKNNKSNTADTE